MWSWIAIVLLYVLGMGMLRLLGGVGAAGGAAYAFGFTYAMLVVINLITPVRVGEEDERGLDQAMHGEIAYDY